MSLDTPPGDIADPLDMQDAVAIVGMAVRAPGAPTIDALWQAIVDGRSLIAPHRHEGLKDAFTDAERSRPDYVPVRPALADVDLFDADFFNMFPREAALTDPQYRIFLELCSEALESAGIVPARFGDPIGVFAGASLSTYFLNNVLGDRAAVEDYVSNYQLGDYTRCSGSQNDTLATRAAFRLGLTGPAITLATACSTSLVAISQACQSLLLHQCGAVLAGGVSITFPQERGYFYQDGGMVSRDGACRPFDADASGTVFGHGGGVVALMRLEDALRAGNPVHAIIRGGAINNDGADKIAFTAPSVAGQVGVILEALAASETPPDSIGYIECHGTGTPLGDPIEFEGLAQAFAGVEGRNRIALGSIKATIGHSDAAAGVLAVIKTALALKNHIVPPLTNFRTPNPAIAAERGPFYFPQEASRWPTGRRFRAGVSSFGVGGTNAHLIMEEPPAREPHSAQGPHIIALSARTPTALDAMAKQLADRLARDDAPALGDVAFTLQEGRTVFAHRRIVVAHDREDAVVKLRAPGRAPNHAPSLAIGPSDNAASVIFMFPGQGSQYPLMGHDLYTDSHVFRRVIDDGADILRPLLGADLRDILYCRHDEAEACARVLRDTAITQPALYLTALATARLWISRGVRPAAMIGHSVGEFVAATIADVMDVETGLRLVAARGRLMRDQPPGAMIAVRAQPEDIAALIPSGIDLAARNAPRLSVYAGPESAALAFEAALTAAGVAFSRLHTSHAFHSAMMDPVTEALRAETAACRFAPPSIPYVSCVTGGWITEAQAIDPDYWARHARACVNFSDALQSITTDLPGAALLEVGPGRTLCTFAVQSAAKDSIRLVASSLPDHEREQSDEMMMAEAFGALWTAGIAVDWRQVRKGDAQFVGLPTYPFERARHWIEAPVPVRRQQQGLAGDKPHPNSMLETSSTLAVGPTSASSTPNTPFEAMNNTPDRIQSLMSRLFAMLEDLSGERFTAEDRNASFLELGFDSLLLGQVTQRLSREMGVELTFRQLLTDVPTVQALAEHIDATLPPEPAASVVQPNAPMPMQTPSAASPVLHGNDAQTLMQAQTAAMLALFENQLRTLQMTGAGATPSNAGVPAIAAPSLTTVVTTPARPPVAAATSGGEEGSRFDLNRRNAVKAELTPEQQAFVDRLCADYSAKFKTSKAHAQAHRRVLADPRTANGFRPEWKELVFPVIADRSKGARIVDLDGNAFIDLVNGFGQTAFGHAPDFVARAITAQLEKGFAIGPQSPLALDVARRFAEMTRQERVTFCNTGSEAVMAAMRLARTVTGKDTIVTFKNDYHGQFDEVLIKGRSSGDPTALPGVSGVPRASVSNMVVLTYGAPESLDWIRSNRNDLAAVLVEPIQSRHPELRPVAFVEELRRITTDCGAALIFDEVVTGFRVARGGIRELWGIDADMTTYGKVIGGGMPIGVLAGVERFMDALDGGFWSFGDDSRPETPPTFFAGTFVRHPLVMAAASAVLDHLEGDGRALYTAVAPRTEALLGELNHILETRGLPPAIHGYSSWIEMSLWKLDPRAALVAPLMRLAGVHVIDGYPWFFTTAHTEEDFVAVAKVFTDSIDALQSVGILAPAECKAQSNATTIAPTAPNAITAPVRAPLTEPQKEIWMAAQLSDSASGVFIESCSLSFEGPLDTCALEAALNDVIARHDALRMRFTRSGEAMETAPVLRLSLQAEDMNEAGLAAAIDDDARTPFDLVEGPLIRARLARLADERHDLILTCHHIVCDGWSTGVIVDDLARCYNARASGVAPQARPVSSFAAYAAEDATREPAAKSLAFWRDAFKTVPVHPDIPTDYVRPRRRSFQGATHVHLINAERTKAIKRAGSKAGATLFGALCGGIAQVIARISGAEEIVLAVPTAGQTLLKDDSLVGHCVNLLPLRIRAPEALSIKAYLSAVSKSVLNAFDHRDVTYGTILRGLDLPGDLNRQPLTEIQFNLDQQSDDFGFSGLKARLSSNPRAYTNFDLIFNVTESPQGLRIDLTYNTDILTAETVARWCRHYEVVLDAYAADAEAAASTVALLTPDEAIAIARANNNTDVAMPQWTRIDAMVAAQAVATPDAIAVEDDDRRITYLELANESDALAAHIQSKAPRPRARIAILVERSVELVVALLAVLKAGHAYVPLDPRHPPARLRKVLETAEVAGVVFDGPAPACADGLDVVLIRTDDDYPQGVPGPVHAEDPTAYVIFTSGSTGTPKGVEISHLAVINFLSSMANTPGFSARDVILAVTTVSFDIAVLELFLPLVCGGRTVIASSDAVQQGFPLVERLRRGDVTVLQATPTLLQMLLEAGLQPGSGLRILAGGEPMPRDLADKLLAGGGEVWNMYGPTETTIWSSCGRIGQGAITIGAPIANTQFHVLCADEQLAPYGVVGELNIGGKGLAKGYYGRADLTAAAFRSVELPALGRQRLYRTGDLAVRSPDGAIRLLGRRDGQIKLRGFRIELGDIEAALRSAPGVAAAAVDLRNTAAGPTLVGYYVPDGAGAATEAIASYVAALLPTYMTPTRWRRLDALPQTMNGKLDRRALPDPEPAAPTPFVPNADPPRTETEEQLHAIWVEVLGVNKVSTTATLFELGVDSLSVFRIAARMLERGLNLDARDLLKHPTIRTLAAFADSRTGAEGATPKSPSLAAYRNGARRAEARIS